MFAAWGTPVIPGFDSATVRITPDGGLEVRVGVHSHGQGMETTFAQIAHEILGIDVARVKVVHGDTGVTPFSTGTYASRSLVMSGGAVSRACKALVPRLLKIGAHMLLHPEGEAALDGGAVKAAAAPCPSPTSPTPGISIHRSCPPMWIPPGWKPRWATSPMWIPAASRTPPTLRWWRWTPIPATSRSSTTWWWKICGTMVNPMVVEGQTYGGVAQGIGTAMFRGNALRRQRPAAGFHAGRLHAARAHRDSRDPHPPLRDAVPAHRVRRQGHGRGRCHRAPGRHLQRRQRCAGAVRRGVAGDSSRRARCSKHWPAPNKRETSRGSTQTREAA
ncbi:molybdopterin cofactor-binding domain-containing protein [Cupriavidus basilensis]